MLIRDTNQMRHSDFFLRLDHKDNKNRDNAPLFYDERFVMLINDE
jgi:hypothetical protein